METPLIRIDSVNNATINKGWKTITIDYHDGTKYILEAPEKKTSAIWYIDTVSSIDWYNQEPRIKLLNHNNKKED